MITTLFILFVAWSTFVLTAASHYGRTLNRVQRGSRAVGIVGVVLSIPGILIGTYGLPAGWSFHWLGSAARVGYVGLILAVAGACAWLVADSVFVWQQRRQVFPFVFRRPPRGKG